MSNTEVPPEGSEGSETSKQTSQPQTSQQTPEQTSSETKPFAWKKVAVWSGVFCLLLVLIGYGLSRPLSYYTLAPGSVVETNDLIRVPDDRLHAPEGELFLTTVAVKQAYPLDLLRAWLDPTVESISKEDLLGPGTSKEFELENVRLMQESQQIAEVVALRRLGYKVEEHGKGALIIGLFNKKAPAAKLLKAGDVIVEVNGQKIEIANQLTTVIKKFKPGDVVEVKVRSSQGKLRTEKVELTHCKEVKGSCIGVLIRTEDLDFDYPFEIEAVNTEIGGPSAGLAFSLTVLDVLTAGELTGGKDIATTGTINLDGTVGDVGGVAQKTKAVLDAGIKLFLVPPGEFAEAKRLAKDDLKVVKVSTLDEALKALEDAGGDVSSIPKGSSKAL